MLLRLGNLLDLDAIAQPTIISLLMLIEQLAFVLQVQHIKTILVFYLLNAIWAQMWELIAHAQIWLETKWIVTVETDIILQSQIELCVIALMYSIQYLIRLFKDANVLFLILEWD